MGSPVVHFEISGHDPAQLRRYYSALFGWDAQPGAPVAGGISDPTSYAFIDRVETPDGGSIPGGIGGGRGWPRYATFYVGVPDVAAALAEAERLGGTRELGPERNPDGELVIAHFRDPEGNLVGLAGPA